MVECLVTGGAGFIGSHLVEALLARGHTVRVLDDLGSGIPANLAGVADRVDLIPGSPADPQLLQRALRGVELVFHQSTAVAGPDEIEHLLSAHFSHATGTLFLLLAAREQGVRRVIYASSAGVYGNPPKVLVAESEPPRPLSPGAAAQLAGEQYCEFFARAYGLETVRLRYFSVYGPRQSAEGPGASVVSAFVTAALAGVSPVVHGDGLQTRDFTYVGDVVQANLLAAETPRAPGRVYNVGFGRPTTVREVVVCLEGLLGRPLQAVPGAPRAGEARHRSADTTLAQKDLGYCPSIDLKEGLRRCLEYYRTSLPGPGGVVVQGGSPLPQPHIRAAGEKSSEVLSES